jgi:hypothetical protein
MTRESILKHPVFLKEEQQDGDAKNHQPLDDLVGNSTPIDQKPKTCEVDQIAEHIGAHVPDEGCALFALET